MDESKSDSRIIIQDDATKPSRFINSDNILYKFQSVDHELEESSNNFSGEYNLEQGDNSSQNDIITVLFTRRYIEQAAKNFVANLGANNVIEELNLKVSRNSCCWSRAPLVPVD